MTDADRAREVLAKAYTDAGQASCGAYIAAGNELTPDDHVHLAAIAQAHAAGLEEAAQIADDEQVDAAATGDEGDALYNRACTDVRDAIRARITARRGEGSDGKVR